MNEADEMKKMVESVLEAHTAAKTMTSEKLEEVKDVLEFLKSEALSGSWDLPHNQKLCESLLYQNIVIEMAMSTIFSEMEILLSRSFGASAENLEENDEE